MARYRKIDVRIWNDEKFRALPDDGKLAFIFVLTHPYMTSLGAMRATMGGLAAELGWTEERLSGSLREAFGKGMLRHDAKASFLWAPKFLTYNPPESPNVVRAWVDSYELVPECSLKVQLLKQVEAFTEGLGEGFRKAFAQAFRIPLAKGMPYQEQEQEQDRERELTVVSTQRAREEPPTASLSPEASQERPQNAATTPAGGRACPEAPAPAPVAPTAAPARETGGNAPTSTADETPSRCEVATVTACLTELLAERTAWGTSNRERVQEQISKLLAEFPRKHAEIARAVEELATPGMKPWEFYATFRQRHFETTRQRSAPSAKCRGGCGRDLAKVSHANGMCMKCITAGVETVQRKEAI